MATQEYAASIQGVSIRVTRLDANGNLLKGPGDSYVTSAFMRVSFTPEYEEGDEITEKNANGVVAVTYKSPDTLKRITMELAICEPDPELTSLLSGGLLLRKNIGTFASPDNKSIGWAAPGVGDDPAGYGVAIETWSHAIKDGKKDAKLPYFYWVFPYVKLRQSGDRVIENGLLANTFSGYGLGNVNFASGIDGRWEYPVAAERPYAYARATWAPVGLNGFYHWNYAGEGLTEDTTYAAVTDLDRSASYNVVNKAFDGTTHTATLTTESDHGFVVGETLAVEGVGTPFNSTSGAEWTLATGTTGSTLVFVNSASSTDVASVAVTDTTAVVYTKPSKSTVAYNVPGNKNFNPDFGVDRVIRSNEEPTA
jgi:hypothetical protein